MGSGKSGKSDACRLGRLAVKSGGRVLKVNHISFCAVLFLVPLLGGCGERAAAQQESPVEIDAKQMTAISSFLTTNIQQQTIELPSFSDQNQSEIDPQCSADNFPMGNSDEGVVHQESTIEKPPPPGLKDLPRPPARPNFTNIKEK